jgi:hypothetical protein
MVDLTIANSLSDGRWSAGHVYSGAEELPTHAELAAEYADRLRFEYPNAQDAELAPFADAFARGWLSVAQPERAQYLADVAAGEYE